MNFEQEEKKTVKVEMSIIWDKNIHMFILIVLYCVNWCGSFVRWLTVLDFENVKLMVMKYKMS